MAASLAEHVLHALDYMPEEVRFRGSWAAPMYPASSSAEATDLC